MLKNLIKPIMLVVLFTGIMYIILAFIVKNDWNKYAEWPVADGKLLYIGELGAPAHTLTGNSPLVLFSIVVSWPHARYSYTVKGQRYQQEKSGFPCLMLAKVFLKRTDQQLDPTDLVKKARAQVERQIQIDPRTGQGRMPNIEPIIESLAPKIKVYYDRSHPETSVLDQSILQEHENLLITGIILAAVGLGSLLLIKFHQFVTAPGPEQSKQSKSTQVRRY